MAKERIQKIIAQSGMCSRRKAEEMISKKRVKCNGHPVKLGDRADAQKDRLTVDGELVKVSKKTEYHYIMLHKPRGYISTMSDEKGRNCVADLVKDVPGRVYPIGRLDVNSEGLLLFTNDGNLANDVMHPSREVTKTYRVTIRPDITDEQAAKLSAGVYVDGRKTAPSTINVLTKEKNRVVLEISITEGRNRQVRKMMESIGVEVARLKRTSVGPLKLGMLQPSKWRELKTEEVKALRNAVKKPEKS